MHRSRAHVLGSLVAGLALVSATAACGAPGVSEAGFAEPTVTLRLGVADPPGRYSWDLAEEFARRVDVATSGTVTVQVVDLDIQERRWNQVLAAAAQEGEVDLALVQAQTWDALGVGTLTPLYVPFLVPDEEALDAVATSDVADELLAGLEGTGVTGLALLPGGMRHVFGDDRVARTPEDLEGQGLRAAYSTTVWGFFEALGARPDDPNGAQVDHALRDGSLTLLDSTFGLADGPLGAPSTAGDVPTYPLAYTLVAHDGALADLSERHQEALQEAATATAAWAADTRPSEADEARALCERSPSAQVVLAGEPVRDAWRSATRELAEQLRSDPEVEAMALRVEDLVSTVQPAEPVQACAGRDRAGEDADPSTDDAHATGAPAANVPEEFPDGTYRKEVTADELLELGVNPTDAHNHADVWTLGFDDGVFMDPGCPGSTYEIVDDRVVVTLGTHGDSCGTAAGQVLFSAGWRLEGDSLTLTDVRSGHGSDLLMIGVFGSAPWTKIG